MSEKLVIQLIAGGKKWDITIDVDNLLSEEELDKRLTESEPWELMPGKYFSIVKDAPGKFHFEKVEKAD